MISIWKFIGFFGLGNCEIRILRLVVFIEQTDLCVARLSALEKEEG